MTARRLAERHGTRIRWWRERARTLLLSGLALYTIGFFLDWQFEFPYSGFVRAAGGLTVLIGATSTLLWLVDLDED